MDDFAIKYYLVDNFLICVKNIEILTRIEKFKDLKKQIKADNTRLDCKKFHKLTVGVDIFTKKHERK